MRFSFSFSLCLLSSGLWLAQRPPQRARNVPRSASTKNFVNRNSRTKGCFRGMKIRYYAQTTILYRNAKTLPQGQPLVAEKMDEIRGRSVH